MKVRVSKGPLTAPRVLGMLLWTLVMVGVPLRGYVRAFAGQVIRY